MQLLGRVLRRTRTDLGRRCLRVAALLLLALPACSGGDSTGPDDSAGRVATVELSQPTASLGVGSTIVLQATVRDASGRALTGRSLVWTSSDPTIASVSASGLVQGLRIGTVQIAASVEGHSAVTTVTVSQRAVAQLQITPGVPQTLVGGTVQLTARVLDDAGGTLDGRPVVWNSADPAIATVNETGVVTGVGVGVVTITATSEGRSASVGVTVAPVPVAAVAVNPMLDTIVVGEATQLAASARDSTGAPLADRPIQWSSSSLAVATVSSAGLVIGVAPGTVDVTAASGGRSTQARVVVLPRPVANVVVSPSALTLVSGQSSPLTVQVTDNAGNQLVLRVVEYRSSNTAVATVSNTGQVTAVGVGTARIFVTSEGQETFVEVTVTQVPIASLRVDPSEASLIVGGSTRVSAIATDASGNVLTGRPVAWSSSATSVATVDATGNVTAVAPGTAQILASSEGRIATATITVRLTPVGSVVVSPGSATLIVGDAVDLSATARNASGEVLTGRTIEWQSSDERIAVVSSTGRVRGVQPGSARITASVDGTVGGVTVEVLPEPVVTLIVGPASLTLNPGTTGQITATPIGRNGTLQRPVAYSSSNPAVATVNQLGVVTGLTLGNATITATSEGKSGTVLVSVVPVPVATVAVSLADPSLIVGTSTTATAVLRDAAGQPLVGRIVAWSSSNTAIATVSPTGVVTAVGPGSATITATSEGRSGSAIVTVSPIPVASVGVVLNAPALFVGQSTQANATPRDASGAALTGRVVTWSSSNTGIATVSSSGMVSAVGAGTVDIIATSEGRTGRATLTVTLPPVATVAVTLTPTRAVPGGTSQASTTLRAADNTILTGRAVTWASSNTNIATVNASGVVTALREGTATITATSEGKSGSATFTVDPPPVATVTVALNSPALIVGQSTQANATLRAADGEVLTGRSITWSSSNTDVATVNSSGMVTAVGAGTVSIIATSEGKSGSANLTVTQIPVATVTVALADPKLIIGATTQATATLRDANGGILTGRAITWTSSNTNVATVTAAGVVRAVGEGTASIIATSEGKTGNTSVDVDLPPPAPVASVSVTLNAPSLDVGQVTQANATLRDANGATLNGRTVTWASSNTNVATVSASGLVTAVGVGNATITATSEGRSGSASLTVTPPPPAPVATVTVSLSAQQVSAGSAVTATAALRDANGATLSGRQIVWSSSNANVATVNAAGVVTTLAPGSVTITATSEGRSGSAELIVSAAPPAPVATVSVVLNAPSLNVGQSTQANATLRDAGGAPLSGRTVVWSSSDTDVARVSATGMITAVGVGNATITATSEGRSGSAPVTVTPPPPAPVVSVTVALSANTVVAGRTVTATATLRDANGATLSGRSVTWTTSNPSVATVSSSGVVSAVGPGAVTIFATSEGRSGGADLTVDAPPPEPVATVSVTLNSALLTVGQSTQANATLRDDAGRTLTGRAIVWSSSDTDIATVSSSGMVTAVGAGVATITARSEGRNGTAGLVVLPPLPLPVASVSVALADPTIVVGATTQATATLRAANGGTLTGRTVVWSSSNASVATVSSSGVVTAVGAGTASIRATSEGETGSATVTVSAPPPAPVANVSVTLNAPSLDVGQSTQANATLRDASGDVLTGRTVTWSSSNTSVATVSASGLVTAVGAGSATITATSEEKSGSASLTVTPPAVATVAVTLTPTRAVPGGTSQATATLRAADNSILTGRAVTWASSNTNIATVNASGVVTAIREGSATITATSEGKSGSATFTVDAPPVATVTVALNSPALNVGQSTQANATLRDAGGDALTGRTVTWTSSNTDVATVSSSGMVTAVGAGSATITATSEGRTGSATLTVTTPPPAPVASVTTRISDRTITVGSSAQAVAELRDAEGRELSGRSVTWSSSNANVATVNASGLVQAIAPGNATITATSEGKSDGIGVTVVAQPPMPVNSVEVDLASSSISVGATTNASATLRSANGTVLTGRQIVWSSNNANVATVNAAGLVRAVGEGTATISATSEGRSGSATVTVTPPSVNTVSVSLDDASVRAGRSTRASATLRAADGRVLTDRPVAWSSSAPSVATVSAAGVVTTLQPGSVNIIATSEGKSGNAALTVREIPVARVVVDPFAATIQTNGPPGGRSVVLRATAFDDDDDVLEGRPVTWNSNRDDVAAVDGNGRVSAVSEGIAIITATIGGRTGFAMVSVSRRGGGGGGE